MKAPLSWLNEYVDISLDPKTLGDRLTEVGLGCEEIMNEGKDVIFDLEITPNRPDLLSIIGIAREIAAIEKKHIKYPKLNLDITKKPKEILPLTIEKNTSLSPRFTGIVIDGIKVKESPDWLKERLIQLDQRPINNIVDITNYVMLELGNPLHAFDYDKVESHVMHITKAKGGEKFKSVDGITYSLPKDAVIVKDKSNVIDLCGIKGGYNTGTFENTKTIFLWAPVEIPILIRKTSQALGLRSEASSIFERGVNRGGTIDAVRRAVDFILEIAGGAVASELYDIKDEKFEPWTVKLRIARLNKLLGIAIPENKIIAILTSLNLSPKVKSDIVECIIPTYRNDLKIEEDVIEEVARAYGYNNFPKTLPDGQLPTKKIPYFKDYKLDEKIKKTLTATGFSEIYSYNLISEEDLKLMSINPAHTLRIDNQVSREYEYLRPSLKVNLIKALAQNKAFYKKINLFELGKVYQGKTITQAKEEYHLAGISNTKNYYEIKGILERLYHDLGSRFTQLEALESIDEGIYFEVNLSELLKDEKKTKKFIPLPKYPPIIEDMAFVIDESISTEKIVKTIEKQSPLIKDVMLLDQYVGTRTFHIVYQDQEKNLTKEEVGKIRQEIVKEVLREFNARLKD